MRGVSRKLTISCDLSIIEARRVRDNMNADLTELTVTEFIRSK